MSGIEELKAALEEINAIPEESWVEALPERKRRELEFHDRDRDRSRQSELSPEERKTYYGNRKYYDTTDLSKSYVDHWIGSHAPGKVFLDYACGNGANAIAAAQAGAALSIGLDISPISIQNARADARKAGVSNATVFVQADAENTKLPDHCVDLVICNGMLHHLDLSVAFPELQRILAPGGKLLAYEALNYNPLIKLYRSLTPAMRTDWEKHHILSMKQVRYAREFFDIGEIRFWHITSVLGAHARWLLPALNSVDQLLTKLPLVRLMAWIFTFELLSKKQS